MSPFAIAAMKAMLEARDDAERENARYGLPMIYSKDGKVIEVPTRPEFAPKPGESCVVRKRPETKGEQKPGA